MDGFTCQTLDSINGVICIALFVICINTFVKCNKSGIIYSCMVAQIMNVAIT